MDQWLSNLPPYEIYLIAVPAVMLGAVLLVGGIILLLERRGMTDSEKLAAIKKVLEGVDERTRDGTPNDPSRLAP